MVFNWLRFFKLTTDKFLFNKGNIEFQRNLNHFGAFERKPHQGILSDS